MHTSRTYQFVADRLHEVLVEFVSPYETDLNDAPHNVIGRLFERFADEFEKDNPRFDRGRFSNAVWLPRLKETATYFLDRKVDNAEQDDGNS